MLMKDILKQILKGEERGFLIMTVIIILAQADTSWIKEQSIF